MITHADLFGQGFPVTDAHAYWKCSQILTHIHFPGQCSGNQVLTGDFMVEQESKNWNGWGDQPLAGCLGIFQESTLKEGGAKLCSSHLEKKQP